jgi:uncharacterized protein YecT (DUF1311 family)
MKNVRNLLFVSLAWMTPVLAEEPEKDPIDVELEAAMEKDYSTAGMVQALSKAEEQWDKKLNTTYQSLKKHMKVDEWTDLVAAQRAWIAYRDAQTKSLETTHEKMEGTMWIPIHAEMRMSITKQRAQFLENMLHNITMK